MTNDTKKGHVARQRQSSPRRTVIDNQLWWRWSWHEQPLASSWV